MGAGSCCSEVEAGSWGLVLLFQGWIALLQYGSNDPRAASCCSGVGEGSWELDRTALGWEQCPRSCILLPPWSRTSSHCCPSTGSRLQPKQGHQRVLSLPDSPPSCSAIGPRLVTRCKTPSPAPAALARAAASLKGAGQARRRYPGTGCSRTRRSSPAGLSCCRWLPHGRCIRERPRFSSTMAPGLVDQSPAGWWGTEPGGAVWDLPEKCPEHISCTREGSQEPAASSLCHNHGLGTVSAFG